MFGGVLDGLRGGLDQEFLIEDLGGKTGGDMQSGRLVRLHT